MEKINGSIQGAVVTISDSPRPSPIFTILTRNMFKNFDNTFNIDAKYIQDVLVLTFFFNQRSDLKVLSSAFNWPHTYPFVEEKSPKRLQIYNIDFPLFGNRYWLPLSYSLSQFLMGTQETREKATNIRKFVFPAKGKQEI